MCFRVCYFRKGTKIVYNNYVITPERTTSLQHEK